MLRRIPFPKSAPILGDLLVGQKIQIEKSPNTKNLRGQGSLRGGCLGGGGSGEILYVYALFGAGERPQKRSQIFSAGDWGPRKEGLREGLADKVSKWLAKGWQRVAEGLAKCFSTGLRAEQN